MNFLLVDYLRILTCRSGSSVWLTSSVWAPVILDKLRWEWSTTGEHCLAYLKPQVYPQHHQKERKRSSKTWDLLPQNVFIIILLNYIEAKLFDWWIMKALWKSFPRKMTLLLDALPWIAVRQLRHCSPWVPC